MTRGIVDPWRLTGPPKEVPKPEGKARIDLADIDFNADLRVPNRYVFRSVQGSVEVHNLEIETANDALRDLVVCLLALSRSPEALSAFDKAGIGCSLDQDTCNAPADVLSCAGMYTVAGYAPAAAVYFLNQSYNDGMARLVRLLNSFRHNQAGERILRRWGVTPMFR